MYGIWTSGPPIGSRTGLKKIIPCFMYWGYKLSIEP